MGKNKICFAFNHRKATQCLNYLALKQGGHIDKLKALKLIYFADRYHLRKYGRFITNDTYFAMEFGPVASSTEDIAERSNYIDQEEREYSEQYFCVKPYHEIESIRPVDYDVFSDSDIEALDFAWDRFGYLNGFELVGLTHNYPEWARNEKALKEKKRIEISVEDFLDDPSGNMEKCFILSDEDRKCLIGYLEETSHI